MTSDDARAATSGATHRRTAFAIGLILALTAVVYSNAIEGEFAFDDVYFIQQNPLVRDLANFPRIFSSAFWEASSLPTPTYYRPMVVLSYAANFALGEFEPAGYHAVNILLHGLNAVLLFMLVNGSTRRLGLSLAVGLLFALHPIQTESVAWISGRTDLLASFFALLSLLLWVRQTAPSGRSPAAAGAARWLRWGSALCLLCALLSKESAITLPLLVILYEWAFRQQRPSARRLAPLGAATALYLACRFAVLGGAQAGSLYFVANPLVAESAWPRLLSAVALFGRYLWLLLVPANLSVDYSYNALPVVRSPLDLHFLTAALAGLGLLALAVFAWRRRPPLFFGLGFFFASGSLIFSNALFPFAPILAERFMYLPAAGFVLALASLADAGIERLPAESRRIARLGALALVLLPFGVATHARNLDWRSELGLFESATHAQPENAVAHYGLANQLYRRHEFEVAGASYRRALEIFPRFGPAQIGLGNVALAQGRLGEALKEFERARRIDPDDPELYVALSAAHGQRGELDAALRAAERALQLNPNSSQIHNNLANLRHLQGDAERALAGWQKAVEIDPFNSEALYNLGYAYERAGDDARARRSFERFLRLDPKGMEGVTARVRAHLRTR